MFSLNRTVCIPIPLFHVVIFSEKLYPKYLVKVFFKFKFGLAVGLISSVVNGNKVIFPNLLPDTLSTIKAIQNEKCTSLKGAPVIFIDLLNHPERKNYDISSLESMLIGASVVPKDLLIKLKKELNLKHIIVGLVYIKFLKLITKFLEKIKKILIIIVME